MKRCRAELTFSGDQIDAAGNLFVVCELNDAPVAFYALEIRGEQSAELTALFVRPDVLRQGIGRLLARHMVREAVERGIRAVTIQGDPNAEDFYKAIGAEAAGYRESASIPGRYLPVFTLSTGKEDNR